MTARSFIKRPIIVLSFFVVVIAIVAAAKFGFITKAENNSGVAPTDVYSTRKEAIQVFDIGSGPKAFNFQLGRETKTKYLGTAAMQELMTAGQAEPRAMISDDFNGDGMGDLVIGYANNGAGVLGMRHGNLQAISPTDPLVFQAITEGRYPSPFLPEVKLYALPEAPDFLQFGDFNSDGYADVMAAARGGERMFLLAGDGRGNLSAPQSFEVPGLITEMRAATQQLGTFTQLAVGLSKSGEARLAVYNKTEDLAGGPEGYSVTGEVTNLAFDQLDGDGIIDLAAATSSEVVVIYGRIRQPNETAAAPALIERQNVPFAIRGLTTGDFIFDRNHQREIALLSDEGTVYLSARGTPDTRPFTKAEKEAIGKLRRSFLQDKIDMETLTTEINKLIRPNRAAGWNVAQRLERVSAYKAAGKTVFQRSNAASQTLDELLIGDEIDNSVRVVGNEPDAKKLKSDSTTGESKTVPVAGKPIAAVSLRLSVGIEPGTVVLGADEIEPTVVMITPNAVFTVNSTADLPDTVPTAANGICQASNGLCTLRAAVMQSSHTGGANTIMVPDGTYTLTLGPPDDETLTGGATEQSGDLDIFSWDLFDGSPILTGVSITGGTRDGCIIQMGTLSPTLAANVPNNKERILEVNDVAVIGFHRRIAVTLTNLTMQNGYSPTNAGVFLEGGAIYYDGSAQDNTNQGLLTLTNVKLSGNTSAGQGGGVWAGFGSLTVNSTSIVRANTATNQSGGGVAWTGGNTVEGQGFTMANSTVGGALVADGNTATDPTFGAPGGLDVRGGAFATISGSTIQNNVANVTAGTIGGGGIQINSPTVAISTSTISNNKSKGNAGGIYSSARNAVTNASSTLTLTTVNVNGNQADSDNTGAGDGGGIFNYFGAMTIQTNSHVDGNSAANGGGIFNAWTGILADPTAALTVNTGSTIGQTGAGNGNSAKNNGGSIAIQQTGASSFGAISLTSLTFTNNTANSDSAGGGDGGAIFLSAGTITSLSGCTFDSNVANGGTGDAIRQTGGTINGAGTLNFNGADSISISGGTFTSTSGTLNLTGNLLFTGGTFTHNSGTVVMNGSTAQTIGTSPITFFNLTTNNGSGVTLNGTGTVAGTLNLTNGVLGISANTLNLNGPVSFTSGTIGSSSTGTVNYTQTSANQNVAPGAYGNLFFNNFVKVLPNGATVGISNLFTPGTAAPTVTGSTVDFNGASTQTVPAINYNSLTISGNRGGATVTLPAASIGVAGTFNPSATNVVYSKTGNTIDFNGSGGQTIPAFSYNNLTSSNSGARTLINGGTIGIAGAFTPGTNAYTNTGNTIDFNGSGTQTISAFNYNNLTSSNIGARTLANSGTIGIAGVFTQGTNAYTNTGSTIDFNGSGGQTIPGFSYNNLTSSSTGARTLDAVNTIKIAGVFTPGTNAYTITGSTVEYNGTAAQTLPSGFTTYNNLTVNNAAGVTGFAGLNVLGLLRVQAGTFTSSSTYNNVQIDAGATMAATAASTINVSGSWTNNGSFTPSTGTVNFNGSALQTFGGTFFNLSVNNAAGVNLGGATTVNGSLVANGTINVGTNTLTLNSGVSGSSGINSSAAGTVNYNQSSNGQNVLPGIYGNVTFSNFTKILPNGGTVNIAGAFTTGAAGGHTVTGSTVAFTGGSLQTLPAGFTIYNNLTVNNAAGLSLAGNVSTNGVLTLTNGNINAGANALTLGSAATVNRTSGHIIGNMIKTYGGTGNFDFVVGTANGYSPVAINVTAGTFPLDFTVRATQASQPALGVSTNNLNRYWTVTPSGGSPTATMTFNYLQIDVPGSEAYKLVRVTGGVPKVYPNLPSITIDTVNNFATINGTSIFSDWTLADVAPTSASVSVGGRVLGADGTPVSNSQVTMVDGDGNIRLSRTNPFGYYRFFDVPVGAGYTISVNHKLHTFTPQFITVDDARDDVDFIASP